MSRTGTKTPTRSHALTDAKYLLDDAAMRDFIVNGYMVFKPDLPADLPRAIYERVLLLYNGVLVYRGLGGTSRSWRSTLRVGVPSVLAPLPGALRGIPPCAASCGSGGNESALRSPPNRSAIVY